ncbi:hypothetical protein B0T17DRAFT_121528 [Bombardia bombarda]|uniref:C2H2-type domain-containing protein n=1 Tax=Bombardia bombarda TaxID=252184 RepID=A0AA39TRW8_9PEZI|nr:hypothetical protein B0T17DRAFT_121528 [Bombardia bombarda]
MYGLESIGQTSLHQVYDHQLEISQVADHQRKDIVTDYGPDTPILVCGAASPSYHTDHELGPQGATTWTPRVLFASSSSLQDLADSPSAFPANGYFTHYKLPSSRIDSSLLSSIPPLSDCDFDLSPNTHYTNVAYAGARSHSLQLPRPKDNRFHQSTADIGPFTPINATSSKSAWHCPVDGCFVIESGGSGIKTLMWHIRNTHVYSNDEVVKSFICPVMGCKLAEEGCSRLDNLMRHIRTIHIDRAKTGTTTSGGRQQPDMEWWMK